MVFPIRWRVVAKLACEAGVLEQSTRARNLESVFIETITVGVFRCNCTVLACEETRQAVVIDPGDDADGIMAIIRGNGLDVTSVIHTHAHIDHIMGTFAVVEGTGATARLHADDRPLWDGVDRVANSFHIPAPTMPPLGAPLADGETIGFGKEEARVIHTPGHTAGSCCFALNVGVAGTILFSGDTLFRGKIGLARPDAKGVILESIRNRLLTFDDETRVIPGHGPETLIGVERRQNRFLSGMRAP
jgi:hydroxyacylglutathione hydrolase